MQTIWDECKNWRTYAHPLELPGGAPVKVTAIHRDFGSTPFVTPAPHDKTLLEIAGIKTLADRLAV